MSKSKSSNPLFSSQREKAGPTTFDKYLYQYHWALYRILKEHSQQKEYAVFIELHEDVVVSDSLNSKNALFEFNQVKTNKTAFSVRSLTKLKNGSSILGKLISSSHSKSFKDQISTINLVSVKDYSLKLKDEDVELKEICLDDLHDDTLTALAEAIKKEIEVDPLPPSLHFVVSDLSDKQFQEIVIAEISKVINSLFPESNCNSVEIYRALYDEVTKKGVITVDFPAWENLLANKALTSQTVAKVINQFTNVKDESLIQTKFNEVATELGLNSITKKNLERSFTRYRQNKLGNKSTLQLDTTKEINQLIQNNIDKGVDKMDDLIENVTKQIDSNISKQFSSQADLQAAIICEFIMS